ncbi:MAG: KaiC 1 [Omnitrophica WOR_2 bacterium RIFOXYB2_FULL_38_16]|nr:MAG: KaiC 1 [Omnitrophica WOR_2 bacterium RIFOXYB2_FULL_38_16]
MAKSKNVMSSGMPELPKVLSGIQGLDEITFGGLPKGRPTLICGGPGCGKTLLAMEFLCRGAVQYNEPGVFIAFEEKEQDLVENFASLGFDLKALIKHKKLAIDYVYIERSEIEETGEYDLEGLFVRLSAAIDSIGAKRVVLDTIEALFSGFSNESILRAELRRLFRWLKDKGVTAVITGEKGETLLTKHGLEEYVADCVIFLDHRVTEQISTRRLKIIKYRGSKHGTNEFPFLIGDNGISVFPMTSLLLLGRVSSQRISSGIKSLDEMFGNKGYFRGSAILVSGSAGSGKTSFGAQFVDSVCREGKRALYFAFEESEDQLSRNMRSIGINLKNWIGKGLLKIAANRATLCGLEMHLVMAHNAVKEFKPEVVVIDPLTTMIGSGMANETKAMMARLLDFLKNEGITVLATDLTLVGAKSEETEIGISSLCDTWMRLSMESQGYKRMRRITIIKSRGMKHTHETKDLMITNNGLEIKEIPGLKENVQ